MPILGTIYIWRALVEYSCKLGVVLETVVTNTDLIPACTPVDVVDRLWQRC